LTANDFYLYAIYTEKPTLNNATAKNINTKCTSLNALSIFIMLSLIYVNMNSSVYINSILKNCNFHENNKPLTHGRSQLIKIIKALQMNNNITKPHDARTINYGQ